MLEHIFQINYDFEPWSSQHVIPVLFFAISGWWLIQNAQKWNVERQWKMPFLLSLLLPSSIILWIVMRLFRGEFDLAEDLPLHMCNLVTFFIPFVFHPRYRSRTIFGVIYFWVMSGTLQAVITPGLEQAFPHFWYLRYWLVHCGLVILILYAILVLDFFPRWIDLLRAFIAMNILFVVAYGINHLIGSNYLYTMAKPSQASLLDYFGPWPYYILVSELVALMFFLLYIFPFLKRIRRSSKH